MEQEGDQIIFHTDMIKVPENTDGLSQYDVLQLNGIYPKSPDIFATFYTAPAARVKRTRRRKPIQPHPNISPGMRKLYDHYVAGGWTITAYAKHLGFSRQTVSYWFWNLYYPKKPARDQIKARTGIDVGPMPLDIRAQLEIAEKNIQHARQLLDRKRGQ